MEQKLRELLVQLCQLPPDFDRAAHLYLDLGVPSVKAMELLVELEDRFGVQVPDEQFVEATSLEKLTAMMEGIEGARA
jgi:acyl carrier protein